MKRLVFALLATSFLCFFNVGCGSSAAAVSESEATVPGWKFLGQRTVQGKADIDEILVTAKKGTFRSIKLEVRGSAVEMSNVVVVFGNGARFSPDTRYIFKKGSQSRVIDLPGKDRVIRKVRFRYGNLPGGGRAHVSLYGR